MSKRFDADAVIARHVAWSCGVGLIPAPIFDIQALNRVQLDLLRALAGVYRVHYTQAQARAWLVGLNGTTAAKIAAISVDLFPGLSAVVGGISRSALCGASTYALGQVVTAHFEAAGTFEDLDMEAAKKAYAQALAHRKEVLADEPEEKPTARAVLDEIARLHRLRDAGVLSEDDVEALKQQLLDRT
ncbi:MAG: GTPase [Minicystis sp.]